MLTWFSHDRLRALLFGYAATLAFWYLFIDLFAWGKLRIPMGLGGALYPLSFSLPVIAGILLYQFGLEFAASRMGQPTLSASPLWRLTIPCTVTFISLIVFCPMDGPGTFVGTLLQRLLGRS